MINYYLLTKPGIILGNLITLAAGFLLASKGQIDFKLFFETLIGLSFIIASACVFNNYIDRHVDRKMNRTKNRALAAGLIEKNRALAFGFVLGMIGSLILYFFTNLLTLMVAGIGFFVYVFIYSLWKCRTIYGTAIGSIAGAVPPVVGYTAVSHSLDFGALILFVMLILWQMPHFYAIAMYRLDDYKSAGIPVLPVIKGAFITKVRMALYIAAFIVASSFLTLYGFTGDIYLASAVILGLCWLWICIKGFSTQDDEKWARDMFRISLIVIGFISFLIPLDMN